MAFLSEHQTEEDKELFKGGPRIPDRFSINERPLFEILRDDKGNLRDIECYEKFTHRPPKALDDDETEFLDAVETHKMQLERRRQLEEDEQLLSCQREVGNGDDVELLLMKGGHGHSNGGSEEMERARAVESKGCCTSNKSCCDEPSFGRGRCSGGKKLRRICAAVMGLWPKSIQSIFCGTKLCCLLVLVPVTVVARHMELGHGYVFIFSLLAIAPLAERLGFVTEQLADFTGPTIGGLLNATFGNATEMIISILALRQNMIRVVQLSLLGSILSNMLLVLGCAFFFGGVKISKKEQKFNKAAALVSSGLLLMTVMCLLFPAVLHATHTEVRYGSSELMLSRFTSCVMLVAYGCYLYFQLKSHREMYDCDEEDRSEVASSNCGENEAEDGDNEEQILGFWGSIVWLGIITLMISHLSDCLVDAIQGASEMGNVPVAFISVVILPIVGNAAEHASSVMFALKDKLDISLGVAIGSSTQISMFVIPFCVVYGWVFGINMDLNFQIFETATLFSTVLVVAALLQEGTATYFKGLMLIFCYLIVSASYWVHVDNNPDDSSSPSASQP